MRSYAVSAFDRIAASDGLCDAVSVDSVVRYCMTDAACPTRGRRRATRSGCVALFDDAHGCEKFAQRVLALRARAAPASGSSEAADEVLYVLDGSGTAAVGGDGRRVEPGRRRLRRAGARRGRSRPTTALELLSVLVHDPEPAPGPGARRRRPRGRGAPRARPPPGSSRSGSPPRSGCPSVTQFIGFVPPGRAPDHFHRYDEVLYILEGEGTLHIDGEEAPLAPGLVRPPAGAPRPLPREHGRRRAASCSASSGPPAPPPRPTIPTAPPPSTPED